mmetsp:Transcript_68402/g.132086  ORF Transcript_68402/g.132086 Transcript_68402/m.132086 type:complete len:230 (-) Transcript_68402:335-1024(-)
MQVVAGIGSVIACVHAVLRLRQVLHQCQNRTAATKPGSNFPLPPSKQVAANCSARSATSTAAAAAAAAAARAFAIDLQEICKERTTQTLPHRLWHLCLGVAIAKTPEASGRGAGGSRLPGPFLVGVLLVGALLHLFATGFCCIPLEKWWQSPRSLPKVASIHCEPHGLCFGEALWHCFCRPQRHPNKPPLAVYNLWTMDGQCLIANSARSGTITSWSDARCSHRCIRLL